MAENRLTRVLRLVDEALQREGDARTAFLDAACSGDAALRKEVESLLARRPQDGAFLESPPWVPDRPPLVAGARLGP
jgi:16S rRNA C967 or C1407 C5-methylase (RsmB/RsmF family)